jgi:hypothetical protein
MWTKFNYFYINAHYKFVFYSNFVATVTSGYRSKSWPLHFHMYIQSSRLSTLPLVDISVHLHTYIHLKLIYNKSTRNFSKWQIYFFQISKHSNSILVMIKLKELHWGLEAEKKINLNFLHRLAGTFKTEKYANCY